jgi:hypothetical protein
MDVIVEAPSIRRYDHAVESAVYFSCLEAIQNSTDPGRTPDGNGLANLRDRLTSLGGEVRIEAASGQVRRSPAAYRFSR